MQSPVSAGSRFSKAEVAGKKSLWSAAVLAAGFFAAAQPANAAVITFFDNNKPGWEAAVGGGFQTEDFSSTTLNPGLSVASTNGSISGGVFNDLLIPNVATTTWNFASPIIGFGANWDLSPNGPGSGIAFTITLFGGGTQDLTGQVPNTDTGQFFGFVSDTPFTSVEEVNALAPAEETYLLDNLVYSSGGTAVPEPASLALLGVGLLGVGFARRRNARAERN